LYLVGEMSKPQEGGQGLWPGRGAIGAGVVGLGLG